MDGAKLGQTLRSGQRVSGSCIASPSPLWPKTLKDEGLNLVFLDTEHVPQVRDTLAWMCKVSTGNVRNCQ